MKENVGFYLSLPPNVMHYVDSLRPDTKALFLKLSKKADHIILLEGQHLLCI